MKHDFFTIKGFSASAFAEVTNPDGRVKVEMPAGSSGLTDIELRASSVPVMQVSGSQWSTLARPVNVRGSIMTAYATEDEVGEVTLLAGVAGEYHDIISVMCANESSAAINLDFRQTTGGSVTMSVEVPATGTAGISFPVPYRQAETDSTWTVQNSAADNSNTVYSVTALFSKEV